MFKTLKKGDVIAEKLPRNKYGCMIVIDGYDKKEKSVLVVISTYLKDVPPTLDDEDIYNLKKHERFWKFDQEHGAEEFAQEDDMYTIVGNIDTSFVKPSTYPSFGLLSASEIYYDWFRETYPEEFQKEMDEETARYEAKKASIVYEYMNEDQFWEMLNKLIKRKLDIEKAIKKLAKYSEQEIIMFNNTLAEVLSKSIEIDAMMDGEIDDNMSSDLLLYSRCFVVVQGEADYYEMIEEGVLDMSDEDESYEELLELVDEALERKGIEIDYDKLREIM
ncbi:DUF4240 domain-containing protein [Macrococcus sp. EM39E]|uniref:DUF4240 domain-containing protein n=1 Tax=Macrococcus animalis TaxID=3395467 RepID=UPI0039BE7432